MKRKYSYQSPWLRFSFVFLVGFFQSVVAQWSTPRVIIEDIRPFLYGEDDDGTVNPFFSLITDTDGQLHLAWSDSSTGNPEIFYSQRVNGEWTQPLNISKTDDISIIPELEMDLDRTLHCAWTECEDTIIDIFYSFCLQDDSAWSEPLNLSSTDTISAFPQLAIDSRNTLFCLWVEITDTGPPSPFYAGYLAFKQRTPGGEWSDLLYTPGGSGSFRPEIICRRDTLHCVWYDGSVAPNRRIDYNRYVNGIWKGTEIVARGNISDDLRIAFAVDAFGRIHCAWYNFIEEGIHHKYRTNTGSWTSPSLICPHIWNPVFESRSDGTVHCVANSLRGDSAIVVHTYWKEGNGWSEPVPISDNPAYDYRFPVLTVDKWDTLHCVLLERSGKSGNILYSKLAPTLSVSEQEKSSKTVCFLKSFPNPFCARTTISFNLPSRSTVSLRIYDAAGELVKTLMDEVQRAGSHGVVWGPGKIPNGIYFCRLEFNGIVETSKMIIQR